MVACSCGAACVLLSAIAALDIVTYVVTLFAMLPVRIEESMIQQFRESGGVSSFCDSPALPCPNCLPRASG